ncbi:MAG: hypothetical protein K0S32_2458 [Bacteroidetes bacterium]|nr:hypothetical protein [Bacteroidota bacterium]
MNVSGQKYDVAFLGSSRVFNIVDPVLCDSLLHANTINLGIGGAAYAENYLVLHEFLKKNQIRALCLQADLWGVIPGDKAYSHPFSEEKYLYLIGDNKVDSIYKANSNPLKFYFRKYIPFFKYAEFNNIFSPDKMLLGINHDNPDNFNRSKGAALLSGRKEGVIFARWDSTRLQKSEISRNSVLSLCNIIELAKSRGIAVVLFCAPAYQPFMKELPLNATARDTIQNIADRYGVPYFDFQKSDISLDTNMFRDYTHLNKEGATGFTKALCDSINLINYGKNKEYSDLFTAYR